MNSTSSVNNTHSASLGEIKIASSLITGCGLILNIVWFSYFVKKENKHLGNRLLMFLNSFDFCVCVSGTVMTVMWSYYLHLVNQGIEEAYNFYAEYYRRCNTIYKFCVECTAFATCLLSVTRCTE